VKHQTSDWYFLRYVTCSFISGCQYSGVAYCSQVPPKWW